MREPSLVCSGHTGLYGILWRMLASKKQVFSLFFLRDPRGGGQLELLGMNPSTDWQHLHILAPNILYEQHIAVWAVSENLYSFLDSKCEGSPLNPADSWKDLQGKYNETDFLTRVGHTAHINLRAPSCRFIEAAREDSACRLLGMALLFLSYVRYTGITPSLSLGSIAVAFKSSIWHFSAWLLGLLRNVSGLSAGVGRAVFPETIS